MGSLEKTDKLWVHLGDCSRKTPEHAHAYLIPHTQVRGLSGRIPACHVQGLRFSPQHYLHISTCMCAHTEIYLGLSHLLKCENEKKFEQVTKLFCKSNISPTLLRNYLLSSSEDGTVRLWSLQTFTCLVGYKGHNYPVWDTQFSPYGYYFVSGGHDRVAR